MLLKELLLNEWVSKVLRALKISADTASASMVERVWSDDRSVLVNASMHGTVEGEDSLLVWIGAYAAMVVDELFCWFVFQGSLIGLAYQLGRSLKALAR